MTDFSYFIDGPGGQRIDAPETPTGEHWVRVEVPNGARIDRPWRAPEEPPRATLPPMTTLDFMRLFTPQEVIKWNAAKAAVAAMTPQDYEDPNQAGLATFSYFNALFVETNTIDTSRADLQAGLDVLIAIGVIASERKAQIIAGVAP